MLLGLGKTTLLGGKTQYPYATGGDYVYLYEEGNKTYRVHEFLSTGTSTLNVEVGGQMDILVVGGGGGGNNMSTGGGGGGAGGFSTRENVNISEGNYSVFVGAGAPGNNSIYTTSNHGQTSSFQIDQSDIIESGGGKSAPRSGNSSHGGNSGLPQNNLGGDHAGGPNYGGGGGGGAGGEGVDSDPNVNAGAAGGTGQEWLNLKYYGGGGGGGAGYPTGIGGAGGLGGGGSGTPRNTPGISGSANTGGGGGGSRDAVPGSGGSGIVIVRYVVAEKKLWTPSELDLGSQTAATWVDTSEFSSISSVSPNFTDKAGVVYYKYGNLPNQASINNNFALDMDTPYAPDGFAILGSSYIDAVILERSAYFVGRAVKTDSTNNTGIAGQSEYANGNFAIGFKMENTTSASSAPAGTFSLMAECSFAPGFDVVYPIIQLTSKSTNTYLSTSDYHIFCVTTNYSTGDINLYANGSLVASSTGNSETIPNVQRGGGLYKISGTNEGGQTRRRATPIFGEFIVTATDDDQNNSQARIKMEGYLAHKWGLTNNLPSGHPYKYEPPYKVEPEEIVTDGLVLNLDAGDYASYPRSGTTWYDISGGGLTGTLTNGPTYDSANKGSIVFDGVNDYVSIPSFNADSNQALSVFCWFNGSDLTNKTSSYYYSWLVNKRDNSSDLQWQLLTKENIAGGLDHRIVVTLWDTTSPTQNVLTIRGTTTLSENTWYYGGFVTDGSNTTLYLNGSSEGTGTLGGTGVRKTGSRELVVATTAWNYTGLPLKGKISNVQIYNRALSSTEITQNFNALRGRYGI